MAEIVEEKRPGDLASHQEVASSSTDPEMGAKLEREVSRASDDYKFTFGIFMAYLSCVMCFYADVWIAVTSSSILTVINDDIGPSTDYVWMVSATYVAVSALSPFVGRLGDIVGRRYIMLVGHALCLIGSIVAGTAHTVNAVIGGAVIIGVGSACHQVAWAAAGEIVPRKWRSISLGAFESSALPASIFGTLFAFQIVKNLNWRWVFWLNIIWNGVGFFLTLLFYHPINQFIVEEGVTKFQQVLALDWVGVFLWATGLTLFLLGLSFGGTTYPWSSAGTLAPLIVGVVILILCAVWELYTKNPYAIFPAKVMRNFRGFLVPFFGTFLIVGMLYYSTLILWPEEIQVIFTTDPTKIGLYSTAQGFGGVIGGLGIGFLVKRVDQARWITVGIVVLATLATGCQAIVGLNTHVGSTVLVVLVGVVAGGAATLFNTTVQLSVPHQYLGIAVALVVTMRNVGGSVGTVIYEVILTNYLGKHLGINVATALAKGGVPLADVPAVAEALILGKLTSPALASAPPMALEAGALALKLSYVGAFRLVYLISITFGILGLILVVFSRNFGSLMTKKVDVKLETGLVVVQHQVGHGHVINHDGKEIDEISTINGN